MDGLTVIRQARAAGLVIRAEGEKLVIRGPRSAEPLAKALIAQKADVLPVLAAEEAEVAWRVEALRGRIPDRGPIIVPAIRSDFVWAGVASRTCSLCGDALPADRQFRCGPCVCAVEAVLKELREGVASDGQ